MIEIYFTGTLKIYSQSIIYSSNYYDYLQGRGGGAVGLSIRPISGRMDILIPAARDQVFRTRSENSIAQTLSIRCECHGFSEMRWPL